MSGPLIQNPCNWAYLAILPQCLALVPMLVLVIMPVSGLKVHALADVLHMKGVNALAGLVCQDLVFSLLDNL